MLKLNKDLVPTIFLATIFTTLLFLNMQKSTATLYEEPKNIIFDKSTNTIHLSSLTLQQKIAQMVIAYAKEENKEFLQKMLIGGIYFGSMPTKEHYLNKTRTFQKDATIPFFIAVDMEGCINPFETFKKFPSLREIKTKEEAYQLGQEQGKFLKELGFNLNFAPVVDLEDTIWNCRNFAGTPEEISEKANSYINGLQENGIIATSKHYPGKTLSIRDPHKLIVYATIDEKDILPFEATIENNVSAIMISHQITDGYVDSKGKPSDASENTVNNLRQKFSGLIITDDIGMQGLKNYYKSIEDMYIDLFKADNDLIINFDYVPSNLEYMVSVIENAVKSGEIKEERIDNSVIRILNAKGINVIK